MKKNPLLYINLIQKCWDKDKSKRPTLKIIISFLKKLEIIYEKENESDFELGNLYFEG